MASWKLEIIHGLPVSRRIGPTHNPVGSLCVRSATHNDGSAVAIRGNVPSVRGLVLGQCEGMIGGPVRIAISPSANGPFRVNDLGLPSVDGLARVANHINVSSTFAGGSSSRSCER